MGSEKLTVARSRFEDEVFVSLCVDFVHPSLNHADKHLVSIKIS